MRKFGTLRRHYQIISFSRTAQSKRSGKFVISLNFRRCTFCKPWFQIYQFFCFSVWCRNKIVNCSKLTLIENYCNVRKLNKKNIFVIASMLERQYQRWRFLLQKSSLPKKGVEFSVTCIVYALCPMQHCLSASEHRIAPHAAIRKYSFQG